MSRTITVVTDEARQVVGELDGDVLLVDADALEGVTGWHLEDRGLCRGDVCVPVRDRDALVRDGKVDLAELGRALHHPTVVDAAAGVAVMVEPAANRAAPLDALEAPDFTLPTLDGEPLSLSELGRKKKLLVCWASW